MPCHDHLPSKAEEEAERKRRFLENALEAVLDTLRKTTDLSKFIKSVDWKAYGTTEAKFKQWWETADAIMKNQNEQREEFRAQALKVSKKPWSKMTADERQLVKDWLPKT
jgi:hypothetical protein